MSDYDHSIHNNPSAVAWAEFFIRIVRENNICPICVPTLPGTTTVDGKEFMTGWFANAMMAMQDYTKKNTQQIIEELRFSLRDALKNSSCLTVGRVIHVLDPEDPEKVCFTGMIIDLPLGGSPVAVVYKIDTKNHLRIEAVKLTEDTWWHYVDLCPEDIDCTCERRPHGSGCPRGRS